MMGDFYKSDPDEAGIIHGASRILFSQREGDEWHDLGWTPEKVRVSYTGDPDRFNVDVPLPGEVTDPIKTLRGWQMKIEAAMKPTPEWEAIIDDILDGKPRQINSYQMAVTYEHGDKDPFYEQPPRLEEGWRAALRWIWACASYPYKLAIGQLEEPRKVIYVFHNLVMEQPAPPVQPVHFHFKDEFTTSLERLRQEMRLGVFKTRGY